MGYLEICYLFSKYLEISRDLSVISNLIPLWSENIIFTSLESLEFVVSYFFIVQNIACLVNIFREVEDKMYICSFG